MSNTDQTNATATNTAETPVKLTLTEALTQDGSTFKATYAPEDNKLRLYSNEGTRLTQELYTFVKDYGFSWAPKQELFVCSRWTPAREDFCIALAGFIQPEQTTLVERAEFKAARLDGLIEKNIAKANMYNQAAQNYASGSSQPILSGHHSQRKAEKAQRQVESAEKNAEKAAGMVDYWSYRAVGVEQHANMKANPKTRYNRIKELLKDMRMFQRRINHGNYCLKLWEKIKSQPDEEKRAKQTEYYCGIYSKDGRLSPDESWRKLSDIIELAVNKEVTTTEVVTLADEIIEASINMAKSAVNSQHSKRFIVHILNRLGYEHSELGEVSRFGGKLTSAILKTFARTHGTESPKVEKIDGDFQLSSPIKLPAHLSLETWLVLDDEAWCDLMQGVGYEVPAPKAAKASILNFKCESVHFAGYNGQSKTFKQIEMTKEEYAKRRGESRGVNLSYDGTFRMKICDDPSYVGAWYSCPSVAVFITDSVVHNSPVSESVVYCSVDSVDSVAVNEPNLTQSGKSPIIETETLEEFTPIQTVKFG